MIDRETPPNKAQLQNGERESASGGDRLALGGRPNEDSAKNLAALMRHHRRVKMLRFVACEILALGIMVASALAGIATRVSAESLTALFRVLPIGAAVVAVILPIFFFGDPKRRNRPRS